MRKTSLLLVLLMSSPALAQRAPFPIPDPDPEVERKSFIMAPGFEVNLYADEPLLAKPIQMNFDAKGRLWVASSEVYPQIKPGQAATDKILVLEDKDGDGKADSTTVFADGLLIPTGVEPGDGGAYVANSTEIVHFKDTDGDGKADSRRVVLSGFGTEDTHHIVHTFRWGEDGMLYFNQSIYIHSHIETPHGPRRLNGGGIWQFRPETMGLEVFARGWVNTWGHHQDAWGASFATDGAGGEGINYIVPGAYYTTAPDAVRILPGLNPGSPKYCGLEVVSGSHLPDDWQGNLITNDFRANRVCRFILSDDGSAFASREQPELIKTTHGAFRPIDVKMGPDGAIYIADWYNPIIQHGEVDFRDPRRDHTRGRIWRVTAKNRPLVEKPKLQDASVTDLLESLKSKEGYTRHFAKIVLKERGADKVIPALAAWTKALDPKDANFEHNRLEALWMYQSLDVAEPDLLTAALNSPDFRVRAAASRVVPHWQGQVSDAVALLAPRAEDENARVRLEAVRALGKIADPRSVEVAMKALDKPVDKWLDYSLWLTARDLQQQWLPALQAGKLDFGGDARKLTFALSAAGTTAVVAPLLESLREGKIPASGQTSTIRLITTLGGAKELGEVFQIAVKPDTPDALKQTVLEGLVAAFRTRKVKPEADLDQVASLLDAKAEGVRVAAIRAVGAWKLANVRGKLALGQGREAVAAYHETLAEFADDLSRKALDADAKLLPTDLRVGAIVALASLDPKLAADRAVSFVRKTEGGDIPKPAEVTSTVTGLLGRKGAPAALAEALSNLDPGAIPADVAKLGVRAVRASGRDESALLDAFTKAGKLASGPVALTDAEMKNLVVELREKGDPVRGEAIFRRPENQCMNCHAIAGAGGVVGPGLESIGASAQPDYLVDSLLQPNKAVKEGYNALTIATTDGRVVTGVKLRDNETETLVRDAEGHELSIPGASIEEKKDAGSLMPVGLTENLTRQEFLDLVRFLTELGKVGPYSVSKARLVRRFQVNGSTKAESLADWSPLYTQVDGTLPVDALKPIAEAKGPSVPVRFELDVTTPGPVRLRLNTIAGIEGVLIDGNAVDVRETIDADLASGRHAITLMVDTTKRQAAIRCELEDVPGSSAKVQPVLGR